MERKFLIVTNQKWRVCDEIREGKNNLRCKEVVEKLDVYAQVVENYEMRDVFLKYKGRAVVLNVGDLRKKILGYFYASKEGGHLEVYRTWVRVANLFLWDGMKGDVREYVRKCDTCQRVKSASSKPRD